MAYGYKPKRTRNIYKPGQAKPFKLSRMKIQNFVDCARCFYLDRRLGLNTPQPAPYNLNSAVDSLLKNEFDAHRKSQTLHPLVEAEGLKLIPFQHENIDNWRNALSGGLKYHHEGTNFIITGAVDDLWVDSEGMLYVVDYKATSRKSEIETKHLWIYRKQVEIYQWLLEKQGFQVSPIAYFLYCNGHSDLPRFDGILKFSQKLLPLKGSTRWIEPTLNQIFQCLNCESLPEVNPECAYCMYYQGTQELLDSHNSENLEL